MAFKIVMYLFNSYVPTYKQMVYISKQQQKKHDHLIYFTGIAKRIV